jgi:flagellar basal-body rod protein FlgC
MSISSLRISGSALTAERVRLDTISQNIANAQTTRSADGGPYHRREVVFEAVASRQPATGWNTLLGATTAPAGEPFLTTGVRVAAVGEASDPLVRVYNPGHPDADPAGYVEMPNVNVVEEMVDLLAATRAYEANVAAANATKTLVARALDLGRG